MGLGGGDVTEGNTGTVTGFDRGKGVVAIEVNKINSIIFLGKLINSINLM